MPSLKVAVLAGGRSSERDVSISSGESVLAGLLEGGHEAQLIRVDAEGVWTLDGTEVTLVPGKGIDNFDVAFPVMHGPYGEDGTLQGLLESLRIPFVGSGVAASAICLDKILAKQRLDQEGISQVDYVGLTATDWVDRREAVLAASRALGSPVWVKPARLGSSVGITRVDDPASDELPAAIELALAHDPRVIVEESCSGREVEVSVIEKVDESGRATLVMSPPGEITLPGAAEGEWYDYARKYEAGGMELVVPAPLAEEQVELLNETVGRAFRAIGCEGYSRVDTFVDGDRVLINEINTSPGFTQTSVFASLFAADGRSYADVLDELLATALARAERDAKHSF